jgi:bifunctional non-homologous end joining protein LigD
VRARRAVSRFHRAVAVRALLADSEQSALRYSDHLEGNGRDIYRQACDLELEGIVCKRKDGRYRSGRNDTWVKVTCRHRETFCAETAALRML